MISFNQFLNEEWKPKIGKIYSTFDTTGDFANAKFAVLGFRGEGKTKQIKLLFFDTKIVDNFDLIGKFAIKINPKSEKEPTITQKKLIDSTLAFIKKLD